MCTGVTITGFVWWSFHNIELKKVKKLFNLLTKISQVKCIPEYLNYLSLLLKFYPKLLLESRHLDRSPNNLRELSRPTKSRPKKLLPKLIIWYRISIILMNYLAHKVSKTFREFLRLLSEVRLLLRSKSGERLPRPTNYLHRYLYHS